jgi:hypothetical protein
VSGGFALRGHGLSRTVLVGSGGNPTIDIIAPIENAPLAYPNEGRSLTVNSPPQRGTIINVQQGAQLRIGQEFP